jgi:hypothetical protein
MAYGHTEAERMVTHAKAEVQACHCHTYHTYLACLHQSIWVTTVQLDEFLHHQVVDWH